MNIGRYNTLRITKQVDFGLYLDGGAYGEILLPKRYVPEIIQVGDTLDVFIYLDSEDRLIATTEKPYVQVGECAYLKVVDQGPAGTFLDWGLPKDLLVPSNEQVQHMEQGRSYVVYVHLDERTQSIIASNRFQRYLSAQGHYLKAGQAVDLQIYGRSDLGFKAIVNHSHLGQLFNDETFQSLRYGQKIRGYIKQIRDDLKIDLSLQAPTLTRKAIAQDLSTQILEYLQAHQGVMPLTDKSPPEQIYSTFQVSKGQFKRTLGQLYKRKLIQLEKDQIRLL